MIHRIISLLSAIVIIYAAYRIYQMPRTSSALRLTAAAAPVILIAQVLMGAANPWSGFEEWARAGHLSLATLLWVDLTFVVSLILLPVKITSQDSGGQQSVSQAETA